MLVLAAVADNLASVEPTMPKHPQPHDPALHPEAAAQLAAWRADYAAQLASPRGWWAITGLTWLAEGPQRIGSAADAHVPLPVRCPPLAATLQREGDAARVVAAAGAALWLDDAPVAGSGTMAGNGATLRVGDGPDAVSAVLMQRGDRLGVRVYDPLQSRDRVAGGDGRHGGGVGWFDVTPGWVVAARADAAADGETLPVVNLLGDVNEVPVAAWLSFEIEGRCHRLVATAAGDGLFVNFRDATSGVTTYGAGRFLRVDAPRDGTALIDFHRAYQPPCAHTPHATCPLPPLANRLPFAVTAGERAAVDPAG